MNFLNQFKDMSDVKKITFVGLLAAIGTITSILEIPFFAASFLKFEVSEAIVIITVMILGLPFGILVGIIKGLLHFMFISSEPIGASVLILSSVFLAIVFHYLYQRFNLLISLIISSILFTIVLCSINYFIVLPLYTGLSFDALTFNYSDVANLTEAQLSDYKIVQGWFPAGYLKSIFIIYVPFNLIKMTLVSAVTLALSKSLSLTEK